MDEKAAVGDQDDVLASLQAQVEAELRSGAGSGVPPGGGGRLQRLNYSHTAMIDLLIARQGKISQNELAAVFGYSPSWISTVMSSDAFQAKLMERSAELVDPTIRASVEEQLKGQLTRSMEILREKLDRPSAAIPDNLVLRTLEISSRALGLGIKDKDINVTVNLEQHLENLGGRLTGLLARKKGEVVSEAEVVPK
jgi:hypothetical protein